MARMAKMAHQAESALWARAELLAQGVSPVQEDLLGRKDPLAPQALLVLEDIAASKVTRVTEERPDTSASPALSAPEVLEVL